MIDTDIDSMEKMHDSVPKNSYRTEKEQILKRRIHYIVKSQMDMPDHPSIQETLQT